MHIIATRAAKQAKAIMGMEVVSIYSKIMCPKSKSNWKTTPDTSCRAHRITKPMRQTMHTICISSSSSCKWALTAPKIIKLVHLEVAKTITTLIWCFSRICRIVATVVVKRIRCNFTRLRKLIWVRRIIISIIITNKICCRSCKIISNHQTLTTLVKY